MYKDEALRSKRIVFYKDIVDQIDSLLIEFLKLSKGKGVFFIDKEGHLITQVGERVNVNSETVSALVAGSFSATRELAKVLGEPHFANMFHKGKKDSISIVLVGQRSMLAVIFDDGTTAGMIDLYCKEAVVKIEKIMTVAEGKQKMQKKEVLLHEDYNESVQARLDELFED